MCQSRKGDQPLRNEGGIHHEDFEQGNRFIQKRVSGPLLLGLYRSRAASITMPRYRIEGTVGTPPLGRGTNPCLAASVPPPTHSLRPPRCHSSGFSPPRLRRHRLADLTTVLSVTLIANLIGLRGQHTKKCYVTMWPAAARKAKAAEFPVRSIRDDIFRNQPQQTIRGDYR